MKVSRRILSLVLLVILVSALIPIPALAADITVITDKPSYAPDELVTISGVADANVLVGIQVKNPDDVTIYTDSVLADGIGAYESIMSAPATLGEYTVYVSITGATDSTTFIVEILPDTGTLSITTTPVTGEVFVDGVSWGDAPQSKEVEVGTYTVTFEDKDGYTTPSAEEAVVTADTTTDVEGIYEEIVVEPQLVITYTPETVYLNDEVTVTVEAEEAPIVNVDVTIINPEGDMQLLKVTDDLGTCTFTADEAGEWELYAFKGGYTGAYTPLEVLIPDTGTLSIITTPVTGEVFVDGVSWGDAPQSKEVDVGTYTVSFGDVEGYLTPIAKEAVVTVDATIEVVGIYVEIVFDTGTLSITTTPVDGEVFVEGISWGDAPQSKEVEVGTYTVTFEDKDGYTTPASQEAVVTADTTTEVEGIYVEIPVGPTADFSIDYVDLVHVGYVDYADVLTVGGSGVTAGTEVTVFWDYASGTYALLLNTTEGKPDGTFECEIKVPSDKVGDHYLWATDESTGDTISYGPITMVPKIKLSPSSGLVGDDITIKGYGFTEEANFTSITFDGVQLTDPTKIETDEDGYFTYTFEVPDYDYDTYPVRAEDFYGIADSADFTLGASITLSIDEGPTGIVVEVEGRGWTKDATISFTIDDTIVQVVDDDMVTVKSAGTFSADIVIPDMATADEYEITATESGDKGPASEDFEVTGLPKIKLSPGFGTPGAMIDIEGYNFTQIKGTEVKLYFGELFGAIEIYETDSDGEFSGTFQAQALQFSPPDHEVLATDEYGLSDDADFRLGMMIVIISPTSGPSGERIYLTGTGFDVLGDWNATLGGELIAEGTATPEGTISAYFYVPTLDVGTYDLLVLDIESEIELSTPFAVTDTTRVTLDPADAPNLYNLTVKGYNFADTVGELEFVLYNATDDWEMDVLMDPGEVDAETDVDGNFTAYWIVLDEEILSIGDYMINVTGSEGLFAQVPFSLAAEVVDVQARKPLFNRGDVVQFDVSNDFKYPDAYMKIWDPYDNLYWETDAPCTWLKVAGLQTVPYYTQTSGGNPMLLAPDAPLGTWTWTFYKSGTKNLTDGTFDVGPSPSALLTGQLDELSGKVTDLTDKFEDVTDDIGELSDEFADRIADVEGMIDDIVDDVASELAEDIATVADDAKEAVEGLGDELGDLAEATAQLADDIADAKKTSSDAKEAAEDAQKTSQGLTPLVYGAIGASLIAALAAVISLMQISKKIA